MAHHYLQTRGHRQACGGDRHQRLPSVHQKRRKLSRLPGFAPSPRNLLTDSAYSLTRANTRCSRQHGYEHGDDGGCLWRLAAIPSDGDGRQQFLRTPMTCNDSRISRRRHNWSLPASAPEQRLAASVASLFEHTPGKVLVQECVPGGFA